MLTGVFILKVRTIILKAENNTYPSENDGVRQLGRIVPYGSVSKPGKPL